MDASSKLKISLRVALVRCCHGDICAAADKVMAYDNVMLCAFIMRYLSAYPHHLPLCLNQMPPLLILLVKSSSFWYNRRLFLGVGQYVCYTYYGNHYVRQEIIAHILCLYV